MILTIIQAYGRPMALGCDAKCDKAWGINSRPKKKLSKDPDDYVFKADKDLPTAPEDPGTYEGGHGKPRTPEDRLNKWCFRECERSVTVADPHDLHEIAVLPDMDNPKPNITR